MKEKKLNITKRIKKPSFALIYGMILFVATIVLVWSVLYNLWWIPKSSTGTPVLGYRTEDITELDEAWITATEEFGGNQTNVDEVEIFSTTGPVIYFDVRIIEGTSRENARVAATEIVEYFIEISDEVALDYNLQVAVSYGDIAELKKENQAAVTAHVHEYYWSLTEAILAFAEEVPSSDNVKRAYDNLIAYENSIILSAGEDELARMRSRQEAITVMTPEQEVSMVEEEGQIPRYNNSRQVPPTEISQFPNWGSWNGQSSTIDWN